MKLDKQKAAILEKLAPGLVAEVNRLIWLTESHARSVDSASPLY